MNGIEERIAAGLERTFAERGFAEPSVDELRERAGVSLRTLYRYVPSRAAMVRAALEHRHHRYLELLFTDLPGEPEAALGAIIDRVAGWMETEASHGCLFHAAVAAAPGDGALRELLERHKAELAARAARAAGLEGREAELAIILEGLTQGWPLLGARAVEGARRLGALLREASARS